MLTLRLFGGMTLSGPEGLVTGRAAQRRRLALLAILAHARGRPVSRDKLIALLWPEADAEQARHLLADSIYVLRGALGEDVLLATSDDVALNPERVTSDIGVFFTDLEAGDRAGAVDVLARGGPFLDGVHVGDAPEFEHWVDATRAQLTEEYRRALEELAREAARRGDREGAIARWRQLANSDRLSSRVALALMHALADAGDVAGALDFARTHERVLQVELEVPPDPSVIEFARELRSASARAAVPRAPSAGPPPPVESPQAPRTEAPSAGPLNEAAAAPEHVTPPTIVTSRPGRRRRVWIYAALTLAFIGVGLGGWHLWRGGAGRAAPPPVVTSIAVLPLVNLGGGPRDAALADGLTREIIAMLATLGRTRVIASASAFALRGQDARAAAQRLGVSQVLEGGMQRAGSRLRVQVRLVDASDGATRWSEQYDRDITDVFAVEDEIANAVAAELDLRLAAGLRTNALRHQTRNIAAYEWFLRGHDPALFRSDSGIWLSLDYLRRAIAADSTYAAAYADVAYRLVVLGSEGVVAARGRTRRAVYADAEVAALKATALDDSAPEGHVALGLLRMQQLDFRAGERELRRALQLDPGNELANETLAYWYLKTGQPVEALAAAQRALARDPLSAIENAEVGHAFLANQDYDSALARLKPLEVIRPPLRRAILFEARCYAGKGMWPEAVARLRQAVADRIGNWGGMLGYALARAGQREEAERMLASLIARWRSAGDDAFAVAAVYSGLGNLDSAFAWLDRAVQDLSLNTDLAGTLVEVQRDPRYAALLQRLGIQKR